MLPYHGDVREAHAQDPVKLCRHEGHPGLRHGLGEDLQCTPLNIDVQGAHGGQRLCIIDFNFEVQGDTSGCSQGSVDIKTKVLI